MNEEFNQTPRSDMPTQPAVPQQPTPPAAPYAASQQPAAPGQPVYPSGQPASPYGQQAPMYQQPASSSKATAALVCGILAILFSGSVLFGIVLGIVALVLAGKAVKEAGKDGKATGGKVCGIAGIVLSVLALIMYLFIGFGTLMLLAANPDAADMTDGSFSSSSSSVFTDEEKQAEAPVVLELDKLKNKDAAIVQQLATLFDETLKEGTGYTLADLGVDSTSFVQWMLADFSYEGVSALTYEDGTGTVSADVMVRDVFDFSITFASDAQAFVESAEIQSMDEAAAKAKLGELLQAAMDKSTKMTDAYFMVDVVKNGDTWTVDQESWEGELDYLFGL